MLHQMFDVPTLSRSARPVSIWAGSSIGRTETVSPRNTVTASVWMAGVRGLGMAVAFHTSGMPPRYGTGGQMPSSRAFAQIRPA